MEELIKQLVKNILEEDTLSILTKSILNYDFEKAMPKMPRLPGSGVKKDIKPKTPSIGTGVRSHKYVKKDENFYGPGQHRYWYKMPDGSLVASKDTNGPSNGDKASTPQRQHTPPEKIKQETKRVQDATKQLLGEVGKKLEQKKLEPNKGFNVGERQLGETQGQYELRQISHALDYLDDFKKRFIDTKTSSPEAEKMKGEILNNVIKNIYNELQKKSTTLKELPGGKITSPKQQETFEQMKNKMNEYEQKGLKNLSSEERTNYFKMKRDVQKIETEEAELTQTKSSIAEQQKREQKSKEYVNDFEKIVKPADQIQTPKTEKLISDIQKAESNGKTNINSPKKDTMLKMNAARFLNRAFKTLNMENVKVDSVNAKGSAMSLAIKAPMKVTTNQIRQLNKLIQRQYGLSSPAQVNYKANNVIEFEFSKQKKEDIIKPMFSDSVKDLGSYIEKNKTPNGLRRLAMVIGYDSKGKPIIADFTNYEATSIATVASPRKGKTFNAESSLLSMISNYSPEEFQFDVIDAQGVAFPSIIKNNKNYMSNQPGMGVKTKEDVQRIIGILESNMQVIHDRSSIGRKYGVQKMTDLPSKSGNRQFPLKMIIMDEYQGVFEGIDKVYGENTPESKAMKTKLKNYMSSIQKQGAKWGVIPWVMTQTVDDNNAEYLQNSSTKMLYQVEDAKTGQDFLGKGGRNVARNIIDVGQSAVQMGGKTHYGVGVSRNNEVTETVTQETSKRK